MLAPHVSRLFIYPLKSFDRVEVDRVTILNSGAIYGDRTWALFDAAGNFVNGKRHASIQAIRSQFDLANNRIILQIDDRVNSFNLLTETELIRDYLSDYLGFAVKIQQNVDRGFPDDTISPGPTIISTATILEIASWYRELNPEEIRRRFRANIEIDGVPAFWEDRLFDRPETTVKFQIGEVKLLGVNPCQRCVVVTRDSQTGNITPNFQKIFIANRQTTLPDWVNRSRFNHFFRLAINTRLATAIEETTIKIGDRLILV
jgi:uncharacterized protein YcbX